MTAASIDPLAQPPLGTDEHEGARGSTVLAGVRRLTLLADAPGGEEAVYAGLARELMAVLGAEEVHVHELAAARDGTAGQREGGAGQREGAAGQHRGQDDLVVVHMLHGQGRFSYLQSPRERPPGVGWAQSSGRSFLAIGPRELSASVPRLASGAPAGEQAPSCALIVPLALAGRSEISSNSDRWRSHRSPIGGEIEAVVVLVRRASLPYEEPALEQAEALVDQAATLLALARARAEAGTDPVAGCMNHRAMRLRLAEEVGRAQRSGGQLSCAIVDLDDFKLVNDRFGHPFGDTVVRQAAQALMGEFRAFDRVARYGGDEFVVILPSADLDSAAAAGERALARMRAVRLPDGSGLSASMGVAQWREPMSADELLEACDAALLRGKRNGKGGVTGARDPRGAPERGHLRVAERPFDPIAPKGV